MRRPPKRRPRKRQSRPTDRSNCRTLKAAEVQSPIRGKKQFLPTRRRIDREINKLKFAYKGEVIMGLTASYGTMSSDDTDIMLILDGIDADGTVATVKPFIGYFYRDNNCLGVRFGYRHMDGNLDAARYDLGESNDASGSIPKVNFNSDNYSFGTFHRSYAGLDPKGRFGLFAEFELSLSTGTSKLSYQPDTASDNMKTTFSDNTQLKLAFNPGVCRPYLPQRLRHAVVRAGRHPVHLRHAEGRRRQQDRNAQGFEHAFQAQRRRHQLRHDGTPVGQEKEINYDQIPENSTPCSRGAPRVRASTTTSPIRSSNSASRASKARASRSRKTTSRRGQLTLSLD